jgi:hypothetical protein
VGGSYSKGGGNGGGGNRRCPIPPLSRTCDVVHTVAVGSEVRLQEVQVVAHASVTHRLAHGPGGAAAKAPQPQVPKAGSGAPFAGDVDLDRGGEDGDKYNQTCYGTQEERLGCTGLSGAQEGTMEV